MKLKWSLFAGVRVDNSPLKHIIPDFSRNTDEASSFYQSGLKAFISGKLRQAKRRLSSHVEPAIGNRFGKLAFSDGIAIQNPK